jgi:hypothetical protein
MAYIYPPAAPSLSGDTETISRFLASPTQVQRRLRSLAEQRYIADRILTGRFNVEGGAILYETGESVFSDDSPRAVAPGAEYPLTGLSSGTASLAKTVKWGQDTLITDESIKRRGMNPVNRAFSKLVNQNVKYVDSVALAAIASAVTQTTAAAADWTTAATGAQILKDVMMAAANIRNLNQGYEPDVVVLDDLNYASAAAAFTADGYFAREDNANNPAVAGVGAFMRVAGLLWLPTPNVPTANVAVVLDSENLGGMADENLGGPGYVRNGNDAPGVESKTIRDDDNDQWKLRVRRVTVPVVVEPAAAWKITGI